jgi:hypothetical protein
VRRAGLFAGTDFMPSAIEQIVDIYVRLKNRRGLDEEIAIIEAGLSRLKAVNPAAL